MYFVEKVKTALQNLESHKVLVKNPVGSIEGKQSVFLIPLLHSFQKHKDELWNPLGSDLESDLFQVELWWK